MALRKAKNKEENAVVGRKTKSSKFSVLTMSEPASKQKVYGKVAIKKATQKRKR